jgi:hypothetical protein
MAEKKFGNVNLDKPYQDKIKKISEITKLSQKEIVQRLIDQLGEEKVRDKQK